MPSKIVDVNPLIIALFDLPPDIRRTSSPKGTSARSPHRNRNSRVRTARPRANRAVAANRTPPSGNISGSIAGRAELLGSRRSSTPDDGIETDTSLLHGESISLTDEEFSDALAMIAHGEAAADETETETETKVTRFDEHGNENGHSNSNSSSRPSSSFTTFRPNMIPLPARPAGDVAGKAIGNENECAPLLDRNTKQQNNDSDEYVAHRGGRPGTNFGATSIPGSIVEESPGDYISREARLGVAGLTYYQHYPVVFPDHPATVPMSNPAGDYNFRGERYPTSPSRNTHYHYPNMRMLASEYIAPQGGSSPPSFDDATQQHPTIAIENGRCSNNTKSNSPKKKKKRKSPIKSLKKLVGRKSSSSAALEASTSFDEVNSSPGRDIPTYVAGDPASIIHDKLSAERVASLKSKIYGIRSTIHALEGDLIATRNELARTHQQLHFATMELADVQRAVMEADIYLSKVTNQYPLGGTASSSAAAAALRLSPLHFFEAESSEYESGVPSSCRTRSETTSSSGDRMNYFTPTSSVMESGEEEEDDSDVCYDDCYTPRSAVSYDSFLLVNDEKDDDDADDDDDGINTPTLEDPPFTPGKKGGGENDATPLTKNGKSKRVRRRFKFDSGGRMKNALTYSTSSSNNKESNSTDTPSTAASSREEREEATMNELNGYGEDKTNADKKKGGKNGRKVTFFKQRSFMRAHDLSPLQMTDDSTALLPLHETDVSDVLNALFDKGLEFATDESDRWIPESSTGKVLAKRAKDLTNGLEMEGPVGRWPNAARAEEVLVWTAKCPHDGYGSEYPMVKARGLVPTRACDLVALLLDSGRTKEYNKMSLGRVDEHMFAEGVDRTSECSITGIRGEAKIIRSQSQPPLIRKPVELRLLLHARRLHSEDANVASNEGEGATYLTIGRSVWETEHGTADNEVEDSASPPATRCEMLLSVNMVRDLSVGIGSEEHCRWCEVTTITHGVSPGIPMSIGKRIALAAAAKYVRDIRAVFE